MLESWATLPAACVLRGSVNAQKHQRGEFMQTSISAIRVSTGFWLCLLYHTRQSHGHARHKRSLPGPCSYTVADVVRRSAVPLLQFPGTPSAEALQALAKVSH